MATVDITVLFAGQVDPIAEFRPRTEFGRVLKLMREQAIASGLKLMGADKIEEELARRRGQRT